GLLAGIVLVSSVQVCVLAHAATPDALLLAAVLLTFTLFWHGYRRDGRLWLVTTGPACGLAVLAKGPVGLALPAAVIGYFLLARREVGRFLDRRALIGVAGFLLVAAPWYVLVGVVTRGALARAGGPIRVSGRGVTGATTFLLSWAAVWLGFFSLAQTKLPNYILPVYPPIALLIAKYLDGWRRGATTINPAVWRVSLGGL